MGRYFGTDGFRGEANVNLTVEHAFKVGRYLGYYFGGDIPIALYRQLECIYRLIVAHSTFLVREGIISDETKHAIDFVKGEAGWLQDFFVLYHLADEICDLLPDCELNDDFMSYVTRLFQCIKDDILQD